MEPQPRVRIDPRWSFWLSILLGAMSFVASSGALLTDTGADPLVIKHVLAWIGLLVGIGNIVNAALAAIPGNDPGGGNFYANRVLPPKQ